MQGLPALGLDILKRRIRGGDITKLHCITVVLKNRHSRNGAVDIFGLGSFPEELQTLDPV